MTCCSPVSSLYCVVLLALTYVGCAVYITANISGGHLNPAVTLATIITGHISLLKGLAYIFVQICGACFGMLMVVWQLSAALPPVLQSALCHAVSCRRILSHLTDAQKLRWQAYAESTGKCMRGSTHWWKTPCLVPANHARSDLCRTFVTQVWAAGRSGSRVICGHGQ